MNHPVRVLVVDDSAFMRHTLAKHHDRDPVCTGYGWTSQLLLQDELCLSYALRGAKDNPEMESFNGRFRTEGHSLFLEAQSLDELVAIVDDRMRDYNTERRHSSIGYVPPLTCIERTCSNLNTRPWAGHCPSRRLLQPLRRETKRLCRSCTLFLRVVSFVCSIEGEGKGCLLVPSPPFLGPA